MQQYIDIGVNLADEQFDQDRPQVLERAREAGVCQQIIIGSCLSSSEQAIAYAEQEEDLFATVGVHPHDSKHYSSEQESELIAMARHPKVVACGEMGLDFCRDYSPRPQQESAFTAQLAWAASSVKKPVYLHERDAFERFEPILKEFRDHLPAALVHCFTGSKAALYAYLDLDCYIGISGWVCDERRGKPLQALVPHIPLNRLVVETDAPYLIPRNLPNAPPVKRRNEPSLLPWIAQQVAALRPESEEQVLTQLLANSRTLFALPSA
ncbi:MAG TPA: TatD family hydrolase [Alcanivoracaceae bacterium]|nr:TatD family hydrolase [Alcanivoracaceae bacterium]